MGERECVWGGERVCEIERVYGGECVEESVGEREHVRVCGRVCLSGWERECVWEGGVCVGGRECVGEGERVWEREYGRERESGRESVGERECGRESVGECVWESVFEWVGESVCGR